MAHLVDGRSLGELVEHLQRILDGDLVLELAAGDPHGIALQGEEPSLAADPDPDRGCAGLGDVALDDAGLRRDCTAPGVVDDQELPLDLDSHVASYQHPVTLDAARSTALRVVARLYRVGRELTTETKTFV